MNYLLDPTKNYSRKSSIVYDENGIPVVRFKTYLPDFKKLSADAVNYMNKYYNADPDKFEVFEVENTTQLELF